MLAEYIVLIRCPRCDAFMTTDADTLKLVPVPEHRLPSRGVASDFPGEWVCQGSTMEIQPIGWRRHAVPDTRAHAT